MRTLVSQTPVQVTSFSFLRPDSDGNWWYTVNRGATGTWSVIRRQQETAPIPPYMRILCEDGFEPVIGNNTASIHLFATGEDAVKHIEDNY